MSKYSVEYRHAAPTQHSLAEQQAIVKLCAELTKLFKGKDVELIVPKPSPICTVVEFKL